MSDVEDGPTHKSSQWQIDINCCWLLFVLLPCSLPPNCKIQAWSFTNCPSLVFTNCPSPEGLETKTVLIALWVMPWRWSWIMFLAYTIDSFPTLCVCITVQLYVFNICICPEVIHKSDFSVNVIKLWWAEQESACLRVTAKLRPKPTATGETWQSCRLGRGRVLSRLLVIMVVAGVQTDSAELVCTVIGRRSVHARRIKENKEEANRYQRQSLQSCTSLDDIAPKFLCAGC